MRADLVWGLSAIDIVALGWFFAAWIGFAPALRLIGKQQKLVAAAMIEHRRAWMHSLLGREMKVHDTQIMGHIMSTAAFFASTTVVVIGALLGILVNLGRGTQFSGNDAWFFVTPQHPLEVKLVLILIVAVYAFLSFTWCIRQANFGAVMIGAAPQPPVSLELRNQLAAGMGKILTQVARSYDSGMRSYYFAIGASTWIASPVLFLAATLGVVVLLYYRQTMSVTATALHELATARRERDKT